jgi:hypothetical protein
MNRFLLHQFVRIPRLGPQGRAEAGPRPALVLDLGRAGIPRCNRKVRTVRTNVARRGPPATASFRCQTVRESYSAACATGLAVSSVASRAKYCGKASFCVRIRLQRWCHSLTRVSIGADLTTLKCLFSAPLFSSARTPQNIQRRLHSTNYSDVGKQFRLLKVFREHGEPFICQETVETGRRERDATKAQGGTPEYGAASSASSQGIARW